MAKILKSFVDMPHKTEEKNKGISRGGGKDFAFRRSDFEYL